MNGKTVSRKLSRGKKKPVVYDDDQDQDQTASKIESRVEEKVIDHGDTSGEE